MLQNAVRPGGELGLVGERGDVDEVLDAGDGDLVEGRDTPGETVHELLKFGVRHDAVDVAVLGGERCGDVIAAQEDLERATPADEAGQPGHWTTAGDRADADLELSEDRLVRGETDIGGEDELAAGTPGAATDSRDRGNGHLAEPQKLSR